MQKNNHFISLIFFALFKLTLQICPPATPKTYGGICYATCAAAGVSYEYRNTCFASCPSYAPFAYQNICYSDCQPPTPKLSGSTCYATCALAGKSYQYQNVCYTSCPANAPYDYQNICYPNCPWIPPNQTYLEGSSCVTLCNTGYADDYQRKCVPNCPSSPILTFKDTTRKICVRMCSTNPSQFADLTSNTCVANCPGTTWGDPDTRKCVTTCPVGTYYQAYASTRVCTSRCYPNNYAGLDRVCVASTSCPQTPVMYYGDDLSNLCVEQCPYNSSTYAENSTQKCVYFCTLGTFADEVTRKCVSECPYGPPTYYGSNITRQCHLQCIEGQFADNYTRQCVKKCTEGTFGDYSTRKCVTVCPTLQKTFADPLTRICISLCSPNYYADNNTRSCVPSINCSASFVGDPLTLRCIPRNSCPSGYYANLLTKLCVTRCPIPYWGRFSSRTCQLNCQWLPPNYLTWYQFSTRTCVRKCPANPRSFSLNSNQTCVSPCPSNFYGNILTYECVRTCPDGYHSDNLNHLCVADCTTNSSVILYMFPPQMACLQSCPQDYYADNETLTCVRTCPQNSYAFDGNNTCLAGCPSGYYADNHSQFCVEACPQITEQYADDSTNMCVKICPVVPDYYGQQNNDGNRKCVSMCSLQNQFADPLTRTCVSNCNVTQGYFGYNNDRRCHLECPSGFGNPFTSVCVQKCPESPYQLFGDNSTLVCVAVCPNQTYGNSVDQMCVLPENCPSNTFADDHTARCVSKCSILLNLFGDPLSRKCVDSCPFGYYADNTTRKCETNCNTTSNYFKDPSTKSCVSVCPSFPDLYAQISSMTCVDTCSGSYYRLSYRVNTSFVTRKCVAGCPSSPVYYADEQTKTCVRNCANQTYLFINNTYRGCLNYCPPQTYSPTNIVDLFADNTTWKCVAVCPEKFYALKHPTNSSIRLCVKMCQIINGDYYFAQTMSRKCVLSCPLRLYGTYGDRISLSCVSSCSRQQFRDNLTKLCQYQCSDGYFADNTTWNCVKKCPNGTFAQSINKTCVKYCPTGYFSYIRTNQCVQYCNHWKYYADNTTWKCVTQCPSDPDYYADYQSRTCVIRCPDNRFAAKNLITTSVSRFCVPSATCPGTLVADPVDNRCLPRCTSDPMYFAMPRTKLCGPNCFDGLFADNTTGLCVIQCPAPYFGDNSSSSYFTCVQYCPNNQFKLTIGRICVSICPDGLFGDNLTMSCVPVCPDNYYGRQLDNICVLECSPIYKDDISKQCVQVCPTNFTADNNTFMCKQKCQYGEYQYNRVCYFSCSDFDLFADNLTRKCLSRCPDDPWTYADVSNHQCVFKCEGGLYAYQPNRTCLSSCPFGYFMQHNNSLCLSVCLENQYADVNSSSCVSDCLSTNQTYINPFTRSCVQKCPKNPDLYGYQNNTCIAHCPIGWFAENSTRSCVQVCPNVSDIIQNQSWADELTHRCVSRCSALSYAFSNSTVNYCVNLCPDGWFASQIQQACVEVCPNDTYAHNETHTCVVQCPNGQYADLHTKICSLQCHYNDSQYRDNSTNMCVERCPENPSMFAQDSNNQCVLTCQTSFYAYIQNRTCVSQCPDPYFIDLSTQSCVLNCPVHTGTFADSEIRKCVTDCRNYTLNYTMVIFYSDQSTYRCVEVCPEFPEKFYGLNESNICVKSCPDGTFGDNDTRICLDKCVFEQPKFTWQDRINNFCVTLCPLNYFADNRTFSCETSCTLGFFADNSTRRCVVTCPVEPASYGFIQNKTCIYFCPNGTFADEITRNCVPRCPTTPFVYYHYTPTNKCVRQCIYPYFAQVQSLNCVRKCQDGFYGNLTTKKCELCKVQCVTCSAYLQCLSCTLGFFLFQYQCVTSCPSYPVMYFAHIQSSTCFLKCPEPYYGQTNTGLCHLACPVLYYGNIVNRVCTKCPEGCLTCDIDGCYSCLPDYVYVEISNSCSPKCNSTHIYKFKNTCYSICPDGSYLSVLDLVTCISCSSQCATCSETASNCTKCAYKFFYNYLCVDACPSNFYVDENLACISCSLNPQKCVLPPLSYTINPFTKNYKMHAYVVFNRVVNMTIQQFQKKVQIKYNGKSIKPDGYTSQVYNKTTYLVTFKNITSLNENALSIGFQPGFIVDMFGNQLTVNEVSQSVTADTGVNEQIATTSQKISTATSIFSWVILAIVLLFLIKSGYPFLVTLQCVQLYYMFTFIRLNPIPYIQLQFLTSMKNVHFLFLPVFFSGPDGYVITQYESFITNTSFMHNCSPFIVVVGFALVAYILFLILSSKKLISTKALRQGAKKIKKYRLKYGIFNDAFWFVYSYAIFMAMLQFTQASLQTTWDTINIVASALAFVVLNVYVVYISYISYKFRDPAKKIPTKWSFLRSQPSHFPLEVSMRYIRRFLFCASLLFKQVDSQCICIIICCFLFMMYLLCYKPSNSMLTNGINVSIQISYMVLAGLYYAYNKLQKKGLDEQTGFSIAMICVKGIILLTIFIWIFYRGLLIIKQSETWKKIYMKITQNKDPQYLKEQQRKRDLEFDWGEFENRSQQQKTDHNMDSSSRDIKTKAKGNIFDLKDDDRYSEQDKFSEKNKSIKDSNSYDGSGGSQQNSKFIPSRTQKIKKPKKQNHLQINDFDNSRNISELDIKSIDSQQQLKSRKNIIKIEGYKQKQEKQEKEQQIKSKSGDHQRKSQGKQSRAIWDDIEFDQHEI